MLEIASQITICLLLAALIGFAIGFIMAKSVYMDPRTTTEKGDKPKEDPKAEEEAKKAAEKKAQLEADKKAAEEAKAKMIAEKKAQKEAEKKAAVKKSEDEAKAKAAEEKAKAEAEAKTAEEDAKAQEGEKPELLDTPRNGEKDDLTQIKGIGPKVEEQLNATGIYHMDQIANWTEANIKWLELNTTFAHRATKDLWVNQAKSFK